MSAEDLFAGVDVGGTNIKVGLLTGSGKLVAAGKFPTEQQRGPDYALCQAREMIFELVSDNGFQPDQLLSAGIATPGPMDIPAGCVLNPYNLRHWKNFNIRDRFAELLDRPVVFANDAGAAAVGEYWSGRGKDYDSLILLTLGTGVGGGIVVGDQSIVGANSHGAEIGHITVDASDDARVCSCGKPGHLEAYASATAIVARCRDMVADCRTSQLASETRNAADLTAADIYHAAESGDQFANELIDEVAFWLGKAVSTLAHTIDPQAVLLGGAMNFGGNESMIGRRFLAGIAEEAANCSLPVIAQKLKIDFASLGSDAGFFGAAGLARQLIRGRFDSRATTN